MVQMLFSQIQQPPKGRNIPVSAHFGTYRMGHEHKSKYGCKDQESTQLSTTPDPGYQWESDKFTARHHKREPRGQPFPSR